MENAATLEADVVAFTDEAGPRRLLRDLTPAVDKEVSVLCTLPIPIEYEEAVRSKIQPLFDRFVAAAPIDAKLHIADAFARGNEDWGAVARTVRADLFHLMHEMHILVIYVARRNALARQKFDLRQSIKKIAHTNKRSAVRIIGEERLDDERIEDDLLTMLALMLDTFAEQEHRKCVDVIFDQIDEAIARRYSDAIEVTRNITSNTNMLHGWDQDKKSRVSGAMSFKTNAPFSLDTKFIGKIRVVGKGDPLIFAVDVVANSLWRHLNTLHVAAELNVPSSVSDWTIGNLVWGTGEDKRFDLY